MKKRLFWLFPLALGVLLLIPVSIRAYREISVRTETVVEFPKQKGGQVGQYDVKPVEATLVPTATETAMPTPVNPMKAALGSGMPVGVIIDRGDGYAVTSVWGKANFYRSDVSPEESMSYSTNGIETLESLDGTLFTQVHSGYYYDTKLFAADIVEYVWSRGMSLAEGQALVKSLVGKIVLFCQSTDGTYQPLQQVDVAKACPNQKMLRISAAAIIDHSQVQAYSQSVMNISDWMSDYEAGMGEFSLGFNDQTKETWIVSTCLYQYNDQPSDGNSFLYGRLVIGMIEEQGE